MAAEDELLNVGDVMRQAKQATVRGEHSSAKAYSERLVELARQAGDRRSEVAGLFYNYCALCNLGGRRHALALLEEASRLADDCGFQDWRGILRANLAWHHPLRDSLQQLQLLFEAVQIAAEVEDTDLWIHCIGRLGAVCIHLIVSRSLRSPLSCMILGDPGMTQLLECKVLALASSFYADAISQAERHLNVTAEQEHDQDTKDEATRSLVTALKNMGGMRCGLVLPSRHPVSHFCGRDFVDLECGIPLLERACDLLGDRPPLRIRVGKTAFWRLGDARSSLGQWESAAEAYSRGDAAFEEMWATLSDDAQRRSSRDRTAPVDHRGPARQIALLKSGRDQDALRVAESCRARAFAVLLAHRPTTVYDGPHLLSWSEIADVATQQRTAIVYFSALDAGCYAVWVISSTGRLLGTVEVSLHSLSMGQCADMGQMVMLARAQLGARCRDEGSCSDAPGGHRGFGESACKRQDQLIQANSVLEQLYALLIYPIRQWIDHERHLLIVPDRHLHMIPFPALRDREDGKYLVQRHSVRVAPSIQVVHMLQSRTSATPQTRSALIAGVSEFQYSLRHTAVLSREVNEDWGIGTSTATGSLVVSSISQDGPLSCHNANNPGIAVRQHDTIIEVNGKTILQDMQSELVTANTLRITFLRGLKPLHKVPEEVAYISDQCKHAGLSIIGTSMAKSDLFGQMESATHLIHLATHGLLDELALVLPGSCESDALLHASEIYSLRLQARLVVLSACNSGLGELGADGVVGLARAFLAAGAQAAMVTLWSVPDRSTCEFMKRFYQYWLSDRLSVRDAVQRAMCDLIDARFEHGRFKGQAAYHPCHWAPFAVQG